MNLEDEAAMFNMGEGCLSHGDEYMRECPTCGMEFCARCLRGGAFCPDCSAPPVDDPDPEDDLGTGDPEADDPEVEKLLDEANRIHGDDLSKPDENDARL